MLDISQGSVLTLSGCGAMCNDDYYRFTAQPYSNFFFKNRLLHVKVTGKRVTEHFYATLYCAHSLENENSNNNHLTTLYAGRHDCVCTRK